MPFGGYGCTGAEGARLQPLFAILFQRARTMRPVWDGMLIREGRVYMEMAPGTGSYGTGA